MFAKHRPWKWLKQTNVSSMKKSCDTVAIYTYLMANICLKKDTILWFAKKNDLHIKKERKLLHLTRERERESKALTRSTHRPMCRFVEFTHYARTHIAFYAFDVEKIVCASTCVCVFVCEMVWHLFAFWFAYSHIHFMPTDSSQVATHTHPFYTFTLGNLCPCKYKKSCEYFLVVVNNLSPCGDVSSFGSPFEQGNIDDDTWASHFKRMERQSRKKNQQHGKHNREKKWQHPTIAIRFVNHKIERSK